MLVIGDRRLTLRGLTDILIRSRRPPFIILLFYSFFPRATICSACFVGSCLAAFPLSCLEKSPLLPRPRRGLISLLIAVPAIRSSILSSGLLRALSTRPSSVPVCQLEHSWPSPPRV